ncbi:MAG: alpha/beta hydrolase-fold protein [Myxococcota bacterium]
MTRTKLDHLLSSWPDESQRKALLQGYEFPLVEGASVTFVWVGDAEAVRLRHWIYGLESANDLHRAENTDLWHLTLEMPPSSRVEYKLEIVRHGKAEWIRDPLNRHQAQDPFGANSVLLSEGYELPDWVTPDPTARPGRIEEIAVSSQAFKGPRGVRVYLPARLNEDKGLPLIVVHDGSDYLRFTGMKAILDNLIHYREVANAVVAFTDSPDRLKEYADHPEHARFVTEELWPALASRYPLIDQPQARCLLGASFGGVASFSTAVRYPGFWGKLLLQSGSFAFTDIGSRNRRGPTFDPVVEFVNRYRDEPRPVSQQVFMSCGVYESLIYENRSMAPMMAATGMQVRLVEARDGHNWHNWRDRLREGLSWLFPGPLLFVYE